MRSQSPHVDDAQVASGSTSAAQRSASESCVQIDLALRWDWYVPSNLAAYTCFACPKRRSRPFCLALRRSRPPALAARSGAAGRTSGMMMMKKNETCAKMSKDKRIQG